MAHLWTTLNESGEWEPIALDADAFSLEGGRARPVPDLLHRGGASLALRRVDHQSGSMWALLVCGAHVMVNGTSVGLGLAALSDRDEIRTPGAPPLFFSTETLAHVTPFPESRPRGFCPRCKQPIAPGTPAVRCPSCSLWYHASDDLGCWTYAPQCSACPQETALDAGYRWTPEEL